MVQDIKVYVLDELQPKNSRKSKNYVKAALGIGFVSLVSAALLLTCNRNPPSKSNSPTVFSGNSSKFLSTDSSCGSNGGATCPTGQCCSLYGWFSIVLILGVVPAQPIALHLVRWVSVLDALAVALLLQLPPRHLAEER
jgi:hypothetical protein